MAGRKKILIVDDDQFLVDMYAKKFGESGFDVSGSLVSTEALDQLRNKVLVPDIILLDLVMPALDGIEFLTTLREEKLVPDAMVIVLTNLAESADVEKAKKIGIDGYIVKASATPSEVVSKVESVAEKRS